MQPPTTPDDTGHPFWNYSLAVYARAGVADACLRLQDDRGADVNILLYCCWRAAVGDGPLDGVALTTLVSRVAAWRDGVIRTLRDVRVRIKDSVPGAPADRVARLRDSVKALELDAEFVEQTMLADLAPTRGPAGDLDATSAPVAAASLAAYMSLLDPGISQGAGAVPELARVLAGAAPGLPDSDISAMMTTAVSPV